MLMEKELLILNYLRENARYTITELARKVDLPRSTVNDRIKKFKSSGIVKKYCCLLNFNRLGLPIQVKILFKAGANKELLEKELIESKHTNNVIKLGNEFDFLASFAFKSMNDLHEFVDKLNTKYEPRDHKIFYIAKDLKREGQF